ncbi:MAG: hypothetical protein FDZ75_08185, partial [Actinobacteria bacterium]
MTIASPRAVADSGCDMEQELIAVFSRTLEAHYPSEVGVSRDEYLRAFENVLRRDLPDAPELEVHKGPLATYLTLSILALSLARTHEAYGLSERSIGERIYRTAEAYFRLPPIQRWIRRRLFFSAMNIGQIKGREAATLKGDNGVNGFKLRYVEGASRDEFGVDYLSCGICDYYRRSGMFAYVKYLCLVD